MAKHTHAHTYFVILVLAEGVLWRVLVDPPTNTEAQDPIISLSQLLYLNLFLFNNNNNKNKQNTMSPAFIKY